MWSRLCLFALLTVGSEKQLLHCINQYERAAFALFVQLWLGSAISPCAEGPVNRPGGKISAGWRR